MSGTRLVVATALFAPFALAFGLELERAPQIVFSHDEHIARVDDTRCIDCHDARRGTAAAPAIRADTCFGCHDQIPIFVPARRHPGVAVPFDHRVHAPKVECRQCHVRVDAPAAPDATMTSAASSDDGAEASAPPPPPPPAPTFSVLGTSESCLDCHARAKGAPAAVACVKCHGRDERRVRPATHDAQWKPFVHGKAAFINGPFAHGERCTDCHREVGCRACHEVERPRDHTALFRNRTHGTVADWDRQRCKTCHETGQCTSCHQMNAPVNHRVGWIATHQLVARGVNDTSCLTCHRPATCIECHTGQ